MAAQPDAAAAGAAAGAQQLPGQPRDLAAAQRGTARVDVRASVFCTVRERVPHPLCGFYAAAFTRLLALFDIGATTEVVACRGTGEATCVLNVSLASGQPADIRARRGAMTRSRTRADAQRCAARELVLRSAHARPR